MRRKRRRHDAHIAALVQDYLTLRRSLRLNRTGATKPVRDPACFREQGASVPVAIARSQTDEEKESVLPDGVNPFRVENEAERVDGADKSGAVELGGDADVD